MSLLVVFHENKGNKKILTLDPLSSTLACVSLLVLKFNANLQSKVTQIVRRWVLFHMSNKIFEQGLHVALVICARQHLATLQA